jgi:hypothetical protein
MRGSVGGDRKRGHVDEDGVDDGTLEGVKELKRTAEVVRQAGRSI